MANKESNADSDSDIGQEGFEPEFQATFNDPIELTYPPVTWDAGMEEEIQGTSDSATFNNSSTHLSASNRSVKKTKNIQKKTSKSKKTFGRKKTKSSEDESGSSAEEATKEETDMDDTTMDDRRESSLTMLARLEEMEKKMQAMEDDFKTRLTSTQGQLINVTSLNTAMAQVLQDYDSKTNSIRDDLEVKVANLITELSKVSNHLHQIEAKVDRNADCIDDLATDIEDLRRVVNSNTDGIDKIQNDLRRGKMTEIPHGGQRKMADTCEKGLFISGIQDLKKHFHLPLNIDPTRVIGRLMAEIDFYFAIDRIFIADKSAKERTDARAAVLYLTAIFHKREVVIRLKTFFSNNPHLRVSINDCFPSEEATKAMALNRMAYKKRKENSMTRTRVINRRGQAILQAASRKGDSYRDVRVRDDELKIYCQQQDEHQGNNKTNSKRRKSSKNKQDRESRDQEKAADRRKNDGQPNGRKQQQQQSSLNSTPSGQRSPAVAMPRGNNNYAHNNRQAQIQQQMGAHQHNIGAGQQMIGAPHLLPQQQHLQYYNSSGHHLPQQQHLQYYNNSGQMWPPLALPMAQGGRIYQMNSKLATAMQMNSGQHNQKLQYQKSSDQQQQPMYQHSIGHFSDAGPHSG